MESANLHHHHQHKQQQQQQLQGQQLVDEGSSSSIPVATPTSSYGVADNYAWTHNTIILNTNNFNHDVSGVISNSRQKNDTTISAPHHPMIQDFNFTKWTSSLSPSSNYQVGRIKEEELQPSSLKKFTEMLNSTSSSIGEDSSLSSMNHIKNGQKVITNDLSEKLMLKTLTSDYRMNPHDFSAREAYYYNPQSLASLQPSRGNFSQIYPSVNISNLSSSTSCLDMKAQPLDLLSSARSSQGICQPSSESICMLNESRIPCGLDHARQMLSTSRPSCSPNKISLVNNRGGETKRPGSGMEQKLAQSAHKKSRSETRTPCPTIKVRKEKLGDRIAALQQLVAPFGKTDTASVLMEAIGYIKFLTNQVETLSVPYIKSSHKKTSRSLHGVSKGVEGNDEPNCDLRSRGLCLVPLSCMSYVAASEGVDGGFWPNP